jgi:hypothetical protein
MNQTKKYHPASGRRIKIEYIFSVSYYHRTMASLKSTSFKSVVQYQELGAIIRCLAQNKYFCELRVEFNLRSFPNRIVDVIGWQSQRCEMETKFHNDRALAMRELGNLTVFFNDTTI